MMKEYSTPKISRINMSEVVNVLAGCRSNISYWNCDTTGGSYNCGS